MIDTPAVTQGLSPIPCRVIYHGVHRRDGDVPHFQCVAHCDAVVECSYKTLEKVGRSIFGEVGAAELQIAGGRGVIVRVPDGAIGGWAVA